MGIWKGRSRGAGDRCKKYAVTARRTSPEVPLQATVYWRGLDSTGRGRGNGNGKILKVYMLHWAGTSYIFIQS